MIQHFEFLYCANNLNLIKCVSFEWWEAMLPPQGLIDTENFSVLLRLKPQATPRIIYNINDTHRGHTFII